MKYQAIILGGGEKAGNLLYPLCQNFSKCLLPVCNKPMILYQLDVLEAAGFGPQDILILVTKNHSGVTEVVGRRAEVFFVSDESESGSALLEASEKIRKDFILLSCDIMIDMNLLDLLDFHYCNKSSITCLMKEEDLDKKQGKAPISCNLDDSYDIMFIGQDGSLLHMVNSEDSDVISVNRNVLMSNQSIKIMSNLFDTHIYVCQYQILNLLQKLQNDNQDLQNWKDEIFPYLIRKQKQKEIQNLYCHQDQGLFQERKSRGFSIKAFIIQGYARRLNNIKDYQQANYESIIKGDKGIPIFRGLQDLSVQIPGDAKIGADVVIAEGTKVGNKSNIQRSIIGKNCVIGDNTKISNSIIMKNVVINQNCIIQHCILSSESAVGHATELNKCYLGKLGQVEPQKKLVEEAIVQLQFE